MDVASKHGGRDRILAAARVELAAQGLEATSVRTIAAAADVTPAMINYYFGGKRALHDAVVAEAQGRMHARLAAAGSSATSLALAYFDFLVEEREMQRLLLREVLDGRTDRFRVLVRPLRTMLEEKFSGAALDAALSVFGAIAGYFIYAPVLDELVGDALCPDALARRRRHIVALVAAVEQLPLEDADERAPSNTNTTQEKP